MQPTPSSLEVQRLHLRLDAQDARLDSFREETVRQLQAAHHRINKLEIRVTLAAVSGGAGAAIIGAGSHWVIQLLGA